VLQLAGWTFGIDCDCESVGVLGQGWTEKGEAPRGARVHHEPERNRRPGFTGIETLRA
jgi:hypothetical protein